MFKGNHDMWMLDYFEKECGVEIISNELVFEYNKKRFFVHHGDGLGPGDRSYKVLKKVFRSRLNRWLYSLLHPNLALGIGAFLSKKSRLAKQDFLEFKGKVTELLPNAMFRVKLENNHEVLAHTAGRLRKNNLNTIITRDSIIVPLF